MRQGENEYEATIYEELVEEYMETDQGSINEIDTMNIVSGLDDPQATMPEEHDSENVVQQEEAKESRENCFCRKQRSGKKVQSPEE